jgi:hypothetical protein
MTETVETTYPGKALKAGVKSPEAVRRVQRRLNETGCGPVGVTGRFMATTSGAVRLFQARFPDATGQPLVVDGVVGPLTWEAMFGVAPSVVEASPSLATAALAVAVGEIGRMEDPPGSNRGARVDEYVRAVGLDPVGACPWCAAFVYWCFDRAAVAAGVANPVVKTAGVLDHWRRARDRGVRTITGGRAKSNPELVRPGMIFVMDFGRGVGHTGFVEAVAGGRLVTIEGNTNDGGSREGVGVFRRTGRKLASINKGFIDYAGA